MTYEIDGEEPSGISIPNSEVSNSIFITNYGTLFLDEKFAEKYGLTFGDNVIKIKKMQQEAPVGNKMENTPICNIRERNEERFHFIHPEIEDEEAWHIHDSMKRLVIYQRIPEICFYMKEQEDMRKMLLPQSPSAAYKELQRMGMPKGEGFGEKYFSSCYMK
jgi:hypothetical protein